jgi:hypothetical protein
MVAEVPETVSDGSIFTATSLPLVYMNKHTDIKLNLTPQTRVLNVCRSLWLGVELNLGCACNGAQKRRCPADFFKRTAVLRGCKAELDRQLGDSKFDSGLHKVGTI